MPELGLAFRIEGAKDAQGKVTRLPNVIIQQLREKARQRAQQTVFRFQTEMDREYTSAWATHRLARGISFKTFVKGDGLEVKFYIKDQRELQFVTAALGGYFQHFPVGPFVIEPNPPRKALSIRFPHGQARQFIRGKNGQFGGSKAGGAIRVRRVLWGNRSGGFRRDVISEVAQQEAELFVQDMQEAVSDAIVKVI